MQVAIPTPRPGQPWRQLLLLVGAAACLLPHVSAATALVGGALLGLTGLNPRPDLTGRAAHLMLQISIVAMGAGMHLDQIVHAGLDGLGITLVTITATLALGHWLGRALNVPSDTALLVSGGTAICGGSAIAALAGALRPRSHDVTVSLATIFLLNAVALVLFPPVGHLVGLTQRQFGWWAALAIHDTSSVVGAGLAYGASALALATTIKLARALWIVPLTLGVGAFRRDAPSDESGAQRRHRFPWFIAGFVAVTVLVSLWPRLSGVAASVGSGGKRLVVLTLFLIGAGFTRDALRVVGVRPLVLGAILWIIVATSSLLAIKVGMAG